MWIAKHLRLSHAYSELETLTAERTAELQKLTQRLLKVQDEERRKLARDLHDTTGQTLAALKIGVSLLQENCKEMPAIAGNRRRGCATDGSGHRRDSHHVVPAASAIAG